MRRKVREIEDADAFLRLHFAQVIEGLHLRTTRDYRRFYAAVRRGLKAKGVKLPRSATAQEILEAGLEKGLPESFYYESMRRYLDTGPLDPPPATMGSPATIPATMGMPATVGTSSVVRHKCLDR